MLLDQTIREKLAQAIGRVYRDQMTTTSGGNFSMRDPSDPSSLWITPAGVDKGKLLPEDMVKVVAGDQRVSGPHRPSSEFPIHQMIYACRPDVKAVIHAHPPALVAYAIARKSPDLRCIPSLSQLCGNVGFADYRLPGSEQLGEVIAEVFSHGAQVVIMENHGVVVGGTSMHDALERLYAAEFAAKTQLAASKLKGEWINHSEVAPDITHSTEEIKPLRTDIVLSETQKEACETMRLNLVEWVTRASKQNLMPSFFGSISTRVEKDTFLISPKGKDRSKLTSEDMVCIQSGRVIHQSDQEDVFPDDSWSLHEEIYQTHPEVNSVIVTQSSSLMAHAVAKMDIDITSNPESWVFVRELKRLPYGAQKKEVGKEDELTFVTQTLKDDCPAVLIENDSVVVVGSSLMQAFDRLEVCEFTAQSIILSQELGGAVTLENDKIEALKSLI